jgi:hypothetical protein
MPSPPFALTLCSVDGDTAIAGVRTVSGGNIIQLSGQDTSYWTSQRWEIYDFPTGYGTPAGWTLDANGVLFSTATTPSPFTVEKPTALFGKYAVRLTVNGGLKAGVSDPEMVDETFVCLVKSVNGTESVFEQEENQFGTSWAEALKRDISTLDKSVGHALATVATTNGTVTLLKAFSMPTNSRHYCLRGTVIAVGDTLAQSAMYDVTVVYTRDSGGAYTSRVASVTLVYETTAGFNVTITQTGTDLNLNVTGAAATNLRWNLFAERFWTLSY